MSLAKDLFNNFGNPCRSYYVLATGHVRKALRCAYDARMARNRVLDEVKAHFGAKSVIMAHPMELEAQPRLSFAAGFKIQFSAETKPPLWLAPESWDNHFMHVYVPPEGSDDQAFLINAAARMERKIASISSVEADRAADKSRLLYHGMSNWYHEAMLDFGAPGGRAEKIGDDEFIVYLGTYIRPFTIPKAFAKCPMLSERHAESLRQNPRLAASLREGGAIKSFLKNLMPD